MINPMIVEGQVLGGIAQGIGGALYERLEYQPDGNLANANFVDFLVPYATEIPPISSLASGDAVAAQSAGSKGRRRSRLHRGRRRRGLGCRGCAQAARAGQDSHHVPLTPRMIEAALEQLGAGA